MHSLQRSIGKQVNIHTFSHILCDSHHLDTKLGLCEFGRLAFLSFAETFAFRYRPIDDHSHVNSAGQTAEEVFSERKSQIIFL